MVQKPPKLALCSLGNSLGKHLLYRWLEVISAVLPRLRKFITMRSLWGHLMGGPMGVPLKCVIWRRAFICVCIISTSQNIAGICDLETGRFHWYLSYMGKNSLIVQWFLLVSFYQNNHSLKFLLLVYDYVTRHYGNPKGSFTFPMDCG